LFQPLLYQVATGIVSEGQIAPATRDVLKKKKNVSIELAEVTGFDLEAGTSLRCNWRTAREPLLR
jgi:NADH:ubiquinone reductase (H+-translocating)